MLISHFPIYKLARSLEALWHDAEFFKGGLYGAKEVLAADADGFRILLEQIARVCPEYGLTHTSDLAARVSARRPVKTYTELCVVLNDLNDSIITELEKEAIFRIPPERKSYYDRDELFGQKVHDAFPSCARDIQKAGSCTPLGRKTGAYITSCWCWNAG